MKRGMIFAAGLVFGIVLALVLQPLFIVPVITPVFSPEDGHKVIDLLDRAETSIDIEMYVFTSRDVIEALERAKNRGVRIRIIIERNVISGQNSETYKELMAKNFEVRYASRAFDLTHSKVIIIDGKAVLVGSHNLSNSALYENREASVIIRARDVVTRFMEVFENDWEIAS